MTRKLDALVAEKVMGWQYRQDAPGNYLCPEFGNNAGWWQEPGGDWLCANCMEEIFPDYSTDIAAAWMVVEKLHEKYRVSFILERNEEHRYKKGLWQAILVMPTESEGWHAQAKNAAEAICLAALKAVGVEQAVIDEALK